jgi:hypothetical protein
LKQLTPLAVMHFGGNVLSRISQLFDKYMDALIKALPGPSDDDSLTDLKEAIPFRAETDSEQLAILGIAFTILDELLPNSVMIIWKQQNESNEPKSGPIENIVPSASTTIELKDWRRHLQHSFDKLKDHFCRQYVLNFIYAREGKTRLDARIYLNGKGEDLYWDSDPLPSLPFQVIPLPLMLECFSVGLGYYILCPRFPFDNFVFLLTHKLCDFVVFLSPPIG